MSDIVEKLRSMARNFADGVAGMAPQDHFCWEAADEIELLREKLHYANGTADANIARADEAEAEIERLRAALTTINYICEGDTNEHSLPNIARAARAALERNGEKP